MPHARARLTDTRALTPRPEAPLWRKLAFAVFALAIGLLGWRGIAIFTAPAAPAPSSAFERIAETVTGPHQVRVEQGETGTLIILIDGPVGALSKADAEKLRSLAGALYPSAPPAIINQYPFASGTLTRPSNGALGELAALGVLVLLSGWLVLTRITQDRASVQIPEKTPSIAPETTLPAKTLKPLHEPVSPVDKAAQLAQKEPEVTAAIIRKWLRQEEGHA